MSINYSRPDADELNHVSERGVTVEGTLMMWTQLEAVFHLLHEATSADGKVNGMDLNFSQYTKEHWATTRTMMMVAKFEALAKRNGWKENDWSGMKEPHKD